MATPRSGYHLNAELISEATRPNSRARKQPSTPSSNRTRLQGATGSFNRTRWLRSRPRSASAQRGQSAFTQRGPDSKALERAYKQAAKAETMADALGRQKPKPPVPAMAGMPARSIKRAAHKAPSRRPQSAFAGRRRIELTAQPLLPRRPQSAAGGRGQSGEPALAAAPARAAAILVDLNRAALTAADSSSLSSRQQRPHSAPVSGRYRAECASGTPTTLSSYTVLATNHKGTVLASRKSESFSKGSVATSKSRPRPKSAQATYSRRRDAEADEAEPQTRLRPKSAGARYSSSRQSGSRQSGRAADDLSVLEALQRRSDMWEQVLNAQSDSDGRSSSVPAVVTPTHKPQGSELVVLEPVDDDSEHDIGEPIQKVDPFNQYSGHHVHNPVRRKMTRYSRGRQYGIDAYTTVAMPTRPGGAPWGVCREGMWLEKSPRVGDAHSEAARLRWKDPCRKRPRGARVGNLGQYPTVARFFARAQDNPKDSENADAHSVASLCCHHASAPLTVVVGTHHLPATTPFLGQPSVDVHALYSRLGASLPFDR